MNDIAGAIIVGIFVIGMVIVLATIYMTHKEGDL